MTALPTRYHLLHELPGRTFALDQERDEEVVIKELALGRITEWKELDLFVRETDLLRRLDHPAIPKMLDAFEGEGEVPAYYLVCEKVPGTPLIELEELDEQRLIRIARRVLEVLQYLQAASPPIIHRDITPEAILVHGEEVYLIDFGSVQVELQATVGGSTMVGTSGYMAPEQLLGRAVPASDVYALGATLVHAMTGIEPDNLPTSRMKLRWRDHANFGSDSFCAWVDRLIAPDPRERFEGATDALKALGKAPKSTALVHTSGAILAQRPTDTNVVLKRRARSLQVEMPRPKFFEKERASPLAIMLIGVAVMPFVWSSDWLFFPLVLIASWLPSLANSLNDYRKSTPSSLSLDVDKGYRLRSPDGAYVAGAISEVVSVETGFGGRRDALWLSTTETIRQIGRGLSSAEIDWLRDEVAAFLVENC